MNKHDVQTGYRPLGSTNGYIIIAKINDNSFVDCYFKIYYENNIIQYRVNATGSYPVDINNINLFCINGQSNTITYASGLINLFLIKVNNTKLNGVFLAIKSVDAQGTFSRCRVSDVKFITPDSSNDIEGITFMGLQYPTCLLEDVEIEKPCIYYIGINGIKLSVSNTEKIGYLCIGKAEKYFSKKIDITIVDRNSPLIYNKLECFISALSELKYGFKMEKQGGNSSLQLYKTEDEYPTFYIAFTLLNSVINVLGYSGNEKVYFVDTLPDNVINITNEIVRYPANSPYLDSNSGTTSNRKLDGTTRFYYDTELGRPVVTDGKSSYKDMMGETPVKRQGSYSDRPVDTSRAYQYFNNDLNAPMFNIYNTWYGYYGYTFIDNTNWRTAIQSGQEAARYLIIENIDLNGETIELPLYSTLKVVPTKTINNGTIIGNRTWIDKNLNRCNNLTLSGEFIDFGTIPLGNGGDSWLGHQFFNRTTNTPIWWDGQKWVNSEGYDYNILKSGTFNLKPNNPNIGFSFYCTDKQTTEGSTNGIMIYYKGDNVWVDALGRIVS